MDEMNDKEAIVNAFELYMDGLSNAYSGAWSEHLPEIRLFCRLMPLNGRVTSACTAERVRTMRDPLPWGGAPEDDGRRPVSRCARCGADLLPGDRAFRVRFTKIVYCRGCVDEEVLDDD